MVTSTLEFEEGGKVIEYAGGYSDWARRGHGLKIAEKAPEMTDTDAVSTAQPQSSAPVKAKKKLSYKYQRELDLLPAEIEKHEKAVAELQQEMARPEFYDKPFNQTQKVMDAMAKAQKALDAATERWIELEEMAS